MPILVAQVSPGRRVEPDNVIESVALEGIREATDRGRERVTELDHLGCLVWPDLADGEPCTGRPRIRESFEGYSTRSFDVWTSAS